MQKTTSVSCSEEYSERGIKWLTNVPVGLSACRPRHAPPIHLSSPAAAPTTVVLLLLRLLVLRLLPFDAIISSSYLRAGRPRRLLRVGPVDAEAPTAAGIATRLVRSCPFLGAGCERTLFLVPLPAFLLRCGSWYSVFWVCFLSQGCFYCIDRILYLVISNPRRTILELNR